MRLGLIPSYANKFCQKKDWKHQEKQSTLRLVDVENQNSAFHFHLLLGKRCSVNLISLLTIYTSKEFPVVISTKWYQHKYSVIHQYIYTLNKIITSQTKMPHKIFI